MKRELRKLIATNALHFAFWVMPDGEFKKVFSKFLINNIDKI
jgi:hypothetical protein